MIEPRTIRTWPPSSWSRSSGSSRPQPGFLEGVREITRRYGVPLDLRRDRHRLPLRLRRRAGILRRGARPRRASARSWAAGFPSPRSSGRRRHHAAPCPRPRRHAGVRGPGGHAQRQPDRRRGRAWPRSPSSGGPAPTSASSRRARASRTALQAAAARRAGLAAQVAGEAPGVRDLLHRPPHHRLPRHPHRRPRSFTPRSRGLLERGVVKAAQKVLRVPRPWRGRDRPHDRDLHRGAPDRRRPRPNATHP